MPGTLPRSSEHSCTSSTGSLKSLDSCLSRNSNQSTRSNRSVGFSTKVKAKKIPRAIDYSDDERNAIWYDEAELEEIKFENKVTLQTSKAAAFDIVTPTTVVPSNTTNKEVADPEDEAYCLRGLEKQTTKYQETTKPFLQKSRAWVLEEQEKQRKAGINDPKRLAKISQQATKSEIRQAYIRATFDKQIAEALAIADTQIGSSVCSEIRAMTLKAKRKEKLMSARHSGSDLVDLERKERSKGRSSRPPKPVKRSNSGPNLRSLKIQ